MVSIGILILDDLKRKGKSDIIIILLLLMLLLTRVNMDLGSVIWHINGLYFTEVSILPFVWSC